jgi:hypothetical protein
MAECHNSADSLLLPRPSLHYRVPAICTQRPVETDVRQAAGTDKQAPPVYVLVESARSYFGSTAGLCRRTAHRAVSAEAASIIPTSIA